MPVPLLNRVYHALARPWFAALAGNVLVVLLVVFNLIGPDLPDGAPGLMEWQLAFSADRSADMMAEWGPDGVDDLRAAMWVDTLIPVAYAVTLASGIAALGARRYATPARWVRAVFVLPFVAAMFDYIENIFQGLILDHPADPSGVAVLIASLAAAIKFALLGIALAVLVGRFTARLMGLGAPGDE